MTKKRGRKKSQGEDGSASLSSGGLFGLLLVVHFVAAGVCFVRIDRSCLDCR